MELGQRLRQARLEAGLSQRQLCGDVITRNMLSQIENGTARPSMATLEYLAKRLGKPIGFFLEEQAVTSPNQAVMDAARRAWAVGDPARAAGELAGYRGPDPVFDAEYGLLEALTNLSLAEQTAGEGRLPYARALLDRAMAADSPYITPELGRAMAILGAKLQPEAAAELPSDDEVLLLRAAWALESGEFDRAAAYLDAAEDRAAPRWSLLRGKVYMAGGDYEKAARYLHLAEETFPGETAPLLEVCCRELGDFKGAYEYACKQR